MSEIAIGRLAVQSGCAVQTIRHYEQIGLLPVPLRSTGNQRRYGPEHVRRVAFIRHARALGLSLPDIRVLLSLGDTPDAPCAAADAIIRAQIAAIDGRMAHLAALRTGFAQMLEGCPGQRITTCHVMDVLADHGRCADADHGTDTRSHTFTRESGPFPPLLCPDDISECYPASRIG